MFYSLKLNAAYRAGNITYTWLYGYTYQIKYTTYTHDFYPDNYCQIDSICFGDGTTGTLYRCNGPISNSCNPGHDGVPINFNTRMNEYVATHTYPGSGNYLMCFEQPNRNVGVINIPNSVNVTMSFYSYLVIPVFGTGKNTSAVFANHPISSGCLNNGCFTYNPSATDLDGDSLSYEILPCKGTTGQIPGYTYPATGSGGTFSINPTTGLLTWCNPQLAGDYNVVIKITEWRKDDGGTYYMIGWVERDTELSIGTCTGVTELDETLNSINLAPNPVSENLNISFSNEINELMSLELFDLTGRKIKSFDNKELISTQNTITVNIENIQTGIYFLKIMGSNNTSVIKKIIKQ